MTIQNGEKWMNDRKMKEKTTCSQKKLKSKRKPKRMKNESKRLNGVVELILHKGVKAV